ncbi:MAG TPA: glycosyltransferase family 4 protein [Thermoplasmata archaeon]|nr:glycosyltransferase family 4 protein [Thermoplasmata archaeon]
MKVAMLTYSTRARGGVAHALKLAERLKRRGIDVTLYSLARSDDEAAARGYFRPVDVPFQVFRYEWHPDVMVRLERMVHTYARGLPTDADVYHSQDCVGSTALALIKDSGKISAPVFRTVHHVDDFAEPGLFEFEKRAVAHADHRFVVSEYWKHMLAEEHGYDSVVTYNGLDSEEFSNLPPRRSEHPTVLFIGGLEARKGLEYLILAMTSVVRNYSEARLIAVAKTGFRGIDEPGWFRILAERAGVTDHLTLLESVSNDELAQLYADCDILVLPSRNEGWGLSLMEAMACSKPVVATRVGGVPELVTDGVEGLLVDPGDVPGLSAAICRLLGDGDERDRMGNAGKERVKAFSWDVAADTVLREYERALQSE